jgi:hypothetical protein
LLEAAGLKEIITKTYAINAQGGVIPENLAEYFGYGLFVGRK